MRSDPVHVGGLPLSVAVFQVFYVGRVEFRIVIDVAILS